MRRMLIIITILVLSLALTGCGKSKDKSVEDFGGLLPGKNTENSNTNKLDTKLPAPPVNTLKADLTSPEGTMRAYMAYLYTDEGEKACNLLSSSVKKVWGGDKCENNLGEYFDSIFPSYDNSLDVASVTKVALISKKATTASGSASITASLDDKFFETFELRLINKKWIITHLGALDSKPLG